MPSTALDSLYPLATTPHAKPLHTRTGTPRALDSATLFKALLLCFGMLLAATVADADDLCNPCTAQIAPDRSEALIPLEGWAFPEGYVDYTVITPPRYGTWNNEVYTPSPEFWQVGGDTITLQADAQGRLSVVNTVIVVPANLWLIHQTTLSFDASQQYFAAPWTTGGDATALDIVDDESGGAFLEVYLQDGQDAYLSEDPGEGGTGDPDQVAGTVEIGVSNPPVYDDQLIQTALLHLDNLVSVDLLRQEGSAEAFQIRASFFDDRFDCGTECSVPWTTIPEGKYVLTIDAGRRVVGPPGSEDWSLLFRVEEVQEDDSLLVLSEHEIWSPKTNVWDSVTNPVDLKTEVGAVDSEGLGSLVVSYDWLEHTVSYFNTQRTTELLGFDRPITMATTSFSTVSEDGWVSIDTTTDDRHGEVDLLDVDPLMEPVGSFSNPGAESRATWNNNSPIDAQEVTALLTVDSSQAAIPFGTTLGVLELVTQDGGGPIAANVILKVDGTGNRLVSLQVIENDGGHQTTGYQPATTEPIEIAVTWRRNPIGGPGSADLWVNGSLTTLTGIDNSQLGVEEVSLGVTRLRFVQANDQTSKILSFDDLLIRHK